MGLEAMVCRDRAICVDAIAKHYNDLKVLDGVSFEVEKGEVFGLIGPNGAGKTTLIRVLTTLTKPDRGSAHVMGFDVVKEARKVKRLIGVVPQENNLDKELTVYENLLVYGMLHKVPRLRQRIEEILESLGLKERSDSLASSLSGGMQRRLVIARALLPDPPLLFLDEPTTGLDPQVRRAIWDIIRKGKAQGKTIVITTHYIEEAENLCDRVGIIHQGKLIAVGPPDELKGRLGEFVLEHIDAEGRLHQWFCNDKDEAYGLVKEKGIPMSVRRVNLEDVFIALTGRKIE